MDVKVLFQAVAKHLEVEAFKAEQAVQTRQFSRDERDAFRLGFYRGLTTDVHRAGDAVWEKAALLLSKAPQTE